MLELMGDLSTAMRVFKKDWWAPDNAEDGLLGALLVATEASAMPPLINILL